MSRKNSECLVALGRYNPPHIGHIELFESGLQFARANNMDYIICPTNTQNCVRNPLNLDQKLKYLNLIAPKYNKYILFNKYPDVLSKLTDTYPNYNSKKIESCLIETYGYTKVTIYHTEPTQFNPIPTVEAKARRYDNISATKIRKAVTNNNFEKFVNYYTVKQKSLNDKTRSTNDLQVSNERRDNLDVRKNASVNMSNLYIPKNIQLVGNLKIEDLKELFRILKSQLECKKSLEPFELPKNITRRIKTKVSDPLFTDPYMNM
jgi:hypothetical protein